MKIIFCGCHSYGLELLKRLLADKLEFAHLVCLSPDQGAQYNVSGYTDLRSIAEEHGIEVYIPDSYGLNSSRDIRFFENNRFDVLIQGGWQRLIPTIVLKHLNVGAIGVHGSADFLPKGRGRSPLNWSLIEDKKRFILHLFLMDKNADSGDILDRAQFDINEFDDIETLYFKNVIASHKMLTQTLLKIKRGELERTAQSGEPSYYAKRTPEDGEIDWENMSVREIYNLVRALSHPYPGAFGQINGFGKCRVWHARPFDTRLVYPNAKYGDVVEVFGDKIVMNCREGLLLIDNFEVASNGD